MKINYEVNVNEEGRKFPHYWELCVGSCHAATILRADVQEQIRKAHKEIGFKYLRFHGLLDDDMSVVISPMFPWTPEQVSFFNIDRVFDFLLDTEMKPFVELGFMPGAFASTLQTTFHYKAYSSMPKRDSDWINLITALIEHLEERYGAKEVRSWFFEVWNEPNLRFFFDGTMKDYFHLYEITAKAIKSVDEKLQVGGPATSNNMWILEFKEFCERNHVPYDFITTHQYPSDDPLSTFAGVNGTDEKGISYEAELAEKFLSATEDEKAAFVEEFQEIFIHENHNPRDVLAQSARKVKAEAGDTPLYYTEWNVGHYDVSYAAAGVAATLAYNENLVEGYSYWCISDIFEESGLHGLPFNDEFGLVNVYGIRKPVYRLYEALHQAGDRRLDVKGEGVSRTAEVLALTSDDEAMIFVYNHDIEERDIKEENIRLTIKGAVGKIECAVIDSLHTNPYGAWVAQGKPAYPTKQQLAELESASWMVWEEIELKKEEQVVEFTLEPEGVYIFRIEKSERYISQDI